MTISHLAFSRAASCLSFSFSSCSLWMRSTLRLRRACISSSFCTRSASKTLFLSSTAASLAAFSSCFLCLSSAIPSSLSSCSCSRRRKESYYQQGRWIQQIRKDQKPTWRSAKKSCLLFWASNSLIKAISFNFSSSSWAFRLIDFKWRFLFSSARFSLFSKRKRRSSVSWAWAAFTSPTCNKIHVCCNIHQYNH